MMITLKRQSDKNGFTLIEMLAAIGIFGTLMVVLSGIFLSAMKSQLQIAYTQYLISDANDALDYMGRTIRMAQRDDALGTGGGCVGTPRYGFFPSNEAATSITFLDYEGYCHQFFLEDGMIKETISSDDTASGFVSEPVYEITSERSNITDLQFNVHGGADVDNQQPIVTILMEAEASVQSTEKLPSITVQTSISQRNLDK